jgi:hypothetical protein
VLDGVAPTYGETAEGIIGCPIDPGMEPKFVDGGVVDSGKLLAFDGIVCIGWLGINEVDAPPVNELPLEIGLVG